MGGIRINNWTGYKTGCGASTENASYSSTCDIAYGSGVSSYPQSTTGNISGIFDMSGGAIESVMGNYNNTLGSSGFETMPDSKYYDLYTFSSASACTLATCGGHALNETSSWYSDYTFFVNSDKLWFLRSGEYGHGSSAGVFYNSGFSGGAGGNVSFRSVIVSG